MTMRRQSGVRLVAVASVILGVAMADSGTALALGSVVTEV